MKIKRRYSVERVIVLGRLVSTERYLVYLIGICCILKTNKQKTIPDILVESVSILIIHLVSLTPTIFHHPRAVITTEQDAN